MYNLPYAYAYALPDMRRITLVLMHILIQSPSSYKSSFSYKTSDDAETYMQHILLHEYLHHESQLHLHSQARLLALKQLVFRLYQESGSYQCKQICKQI